MTIYGIKNCDTVKKALTWLKEHDVAYEFHDYKTKGVTDDKLRSWAGQVGWETLVNRKGTTWRQLDDADKDAVRDEASAIALMKEKTSVIKRPLLEEKGKVLSVGFDAGTYTDLFNAK
jgi:Spx/MgsR family transcriptional regulator